MGPNRGAFTPLWVQGADYPEGGSGWVRGQRRGRRSQEGLCQTLDRRWAGKRCLTDALPGESGQDDQAGDARLGTGGEQLTFCPGAGMRSRLPRKQHVCGFEGADGTSLAWNSRGGPTWPLAELPMAAAPGPAGYAGLPPPACSTLGILGPCPNHDPTCNPNPGPERSPLCGSSVC